MQFLCDTHVHTETSLHARGTIDEIAQRAAQLGLQGVAITDHASLKMVHFERSLEVLGEQAIPPYSHGVRLWRGVEIDIHDYKGHLCFHNVPYDEKESALDHFLKTREIVIASPHYKPEDRCGDYTEVTDMFLGVVANPYVTTIGHPERIGLDYDMAALALACARTGTFLEVNNSSLNSGYHDAVRAQLEICANLGTTIVVNSDAHSPDYVGVRDRARALLYEIDYPKELIANLNIETFTAALKRQNELKRQ